MNADLSLVSIVIQLTDKQRFILKSIAQEKGLSMSKYILSKFEKELNSIKYK